MNTKNNKTTMNTNKKTATMVPTKNRRNKDWFNNKNQLKNPKVFTLKAVRDSDGKFHIIGGETMMLERKNQHSATWVKVDTRNFTSILRNSKITCR